MSYTQLNKTKKAKQQYKSSTAKPVEFEGLYLGDNNYERWLFEITKEEHVRLVDKFCRLTDTASCFKYDDYRECLVAVGKLGSHLNGESLDGQCMNQVCTIKGEIKRYVVEVPIPTEDEDNNGEAVVSNDDPPQKLTREQRGVLLLILSVTPLPFKKQPEAVREMLKGQQKEKRKDENQASNNNKKSKSEKIGRRMMADVTDGDGTMDE